MFKLKVIIGSTRPGRNADLVTKWVVSSATKHGAFDVEVLDLREWQLPFFQETIASVGDFADPTYSVEIVKKWNEKIREADGYIIVTPEYNRSIPAVLKNAIDSVFFSFAFRSKPVAFVGYSLGPTSGARAVEHLGQIMMETEAVPVKTSTLIPLVTNAFDAQHQPNNPLLDVNLSVMLDDLAWMSKVFKGARSESHLLPSALRIRAKRENPGK